MKKGFVSVIGMILSVIMCFSMLGCGGGGSTVTPPPDGETEEKADRPTVDGVPYGEGRTLNIYIPGTKPAELDKVIAEYKKRTKDEFAFDLKFKFDQLDNYKQNLTLQIGSGAASELDLVFDAQWIYLQDWSKKGNYVKLDKYFQNDNFPGLKKAFDKDYLTNNKWNNGVYGIPLTESYGSTNAAFYRLDWAKASQIPELADGIDSNEEVELYLDWVKKNKSGSPLLANKDGYGPFNLAGGFYDKGDKPTVSQSNQKGVRQGWNIYNNIILSAYINQETGEVSGLYVPQYESAQETFDFPAPFNSDEAHTGNWQASYNKVRDWYEKGYISPNVLNEVDAEAKFRAGQGGMVLRNLEQFPAMNAELQKNDPNAELEIFMFSKAERDMIQPQWGTDFKAWNYLAVPSTSPNADLAMLFMDWLFASRENHDLFQYGIEGVNWQKIDPATPDGSYQALITKDHVPYTLPGYYLTWNPNYLRSPAGISEKAAKYIKYVQDPKTYTTYLYSEFRFDYTEVQSELLNPSFGTYATQSIPFYLGTQQDPVAKFNQIITNRIANKKFQDDLAIIKAEFRRQLQEFIDNAV